MQNEIFRFGVIRSPKKIQEAELELISIEIKYDERNPQPGMRIIRDIVDPRNQVKERFERGNKNLIFFSKSDFIKNNAELFNFSGKIESATSIEKIINDKILDDLPEINPEVKIKIEDSIVYGTITNFDDKSWNGILRSIYRTINIIEKIDAEESIKKNPKALNKLVNAIILLPKEIFPLPNKNEEKKRTNKKAESDYQDKTEKVKKAFNEKNIAHAKAIEEITDVHNQFISSVKNGDTKRFDTLSRLTKGFTNKISKDTQTFVKKEIGIGELHQVDIPEIVNKIDRKTEKISLASVQKELFPTFEANISFILPIPGPCNSVEFVEKRNNESLMSDLQGYVEFLGIMDLKKVKQELVSYEAGELAHVENVLNGESKTKTHRKLDRIEETLFEETERTEEAEKNLQTTDRYELQRESENTVVEETSKEAGVNVTGSYGRVKVEAHGKFTSNKSQTKSQKSTSNYAKEVVSKSVQKIKERILNRRSTTTISELEITNEHIIANTSGAHIVGKYHWLNKYYKAQIVNYGERAILSFMVPEPAAFYKFAKMEKPIGDQMEPPEIPTLCLNGKTIPLTPEKITSYNYMYWVGKYNVQDISAPPAVYINVADSLDLKIDKSDESNNVINTKHESLSIPANYSPLICKYNISGGSANTYTNPGKGHDDMLFVSVKIGNDEVFSIYKNEIGKGENDEKEKATKRDQLIDWHNEFDVNEKDLKSIKKGKLVDEIPLDKDFLNSSNIPVSFSGVTTLPIGVSIHFTIQCIRKPEAYAQWQMETYNNIIEAYRGMLLEYEENVTQQEFTTDINIQGQNPLINRQVEANELKRQTISIMSGQHFEAFNAMEVDHSKNGIHRYPQLNFEDAEIEGKFVRFYEQSFEWQNMVYNFYPYFWGRKEEWINNINLKDNDPLFEKFLRAGYAKVEVPIRPGYEAEVFERVTVNTSFETEVDINALPNNDATENYLSVFTEMIESLGHEYGEQPSGTISIEHDTKTVTGTGTNFTEDLVDREIIIDMKSYRIREVNSETELLIDKPYRSEKTEAAEQDLENVGFWLGPKFEGEPWLVEVPTSLVILSN